jgi:hypothetical protein
MSMDNYKPRTLVVGERIYTYRAFGYGEGQFSKEIVEKITPTGKIVVRLESTSAVTRYTPEGRMIGAEKYDTRGIDWMPMDERDQYLHERTQLANAAELLNEINKAEDIKASWGEEVLRKRLDTIQATINKAREILSSLKSTKLPEPAAASNRVALEPESWTIAKESNAGN